MQPGALLNIDAKGNVTYQAFAGENNSLTVQLANGNYTFTDTGVAGIIVTGPACVTFQVSSPRAREATVTVPIGPAPC